MVGLASTMAFMTADDPLLAALSDLAGALRKIDAPSMIIGGMAVLARGIARQTADVDATLWSEHIELDRLFDTFANHHIEPRIADAKTFARDRNVLLLRHQPTGTPLDVSLAYLPFEKDWSSSSRAHWKSPSVSRLLTHSCVARSRPEDARLRGHRNGHKQLVSDKGSMRVRLRDGSGDLPARDDGRLARGADAWQL
jgi:hypothetical protein